MNYKERKLACSLLNENLREISIRMSEEFPTAVPVMVCYLQETGKLMLINPDGEMNSEIAKAIAKTILIGTEGTEIITRNN